MADKKKSKKIVKTKFTQGKKSGKYKKKIIVLFSMVVVLGIIISLMNFFLEVGKTDNGESCVRVQTTCCSCRSGGEEVCVLESEKVDYAINQSECSERRICVQMFNCNPGSCENVDGVCGFIEE